VRLPRFASHPIEEIHIASGRLVPKYSAFFAGGTLVPDFRTGCQTKRHHGESRDLHRCELSYIHAIRPSMNGELLASSYAAKKLPACSNRR
jgi:hypothetical protein